MRTFAQVKAEYAALWRDSTLDESHRDEVSSVARKILALRPRYEPIFDATGVPWFVIGIIHAMECSKFPECSQHLHNGDPLYRRTRLVPAGRPAKGTAPFTFEESAIDALTMDGKEFNKITDWSIERVAYCLELYNGWGYRGRGIHSPYLWSYTSAYSGGKYVRDHVWSSTAVSEQVGGMALLKMLMEIDPSAVDFTPPEKTAAPWPKAMDHGAVPSSPGVTKVKVASQSWSVWSGITALGMWFANTFQSVSDWLGRGVSWLLHYIGDLVQTVLSILPDAAGAGQAAVAALQSLGSMIGHNLKYGLAAIGIVATLNFIWRHVDFKTATLRKSGE
jgi:lysozyme family protein